MPMPNVRLRRRIAATALVVLALLAAAIAWKGAKIYEKVLDLR